MTVIRTTYDPKPIPLRQFDWSATWGDYDLDDPIGYGATEQEAMCDLIDNYPVEEFDADSLGFLRGAANALAIELAVVLFGVLAYAAYHTQTVVRFF